MVTIKPFKGIHPKRESAQKVASLPYDVLSSDEARELAKSNNISFLRVIKAEIDFNAEENPSKTDILKRAKENFKKLKEESVMVQDEQTGFYLYRQIMGKHTQIGLVAGASVEDYRQDRIKKHEHTRPEKEDDRTMHMETLKVNTGPIFLTYQNNKEIDQFVETYISHHQPILDFTAEDGISHTVWQISEKEDIQKIETAFKGISSLYVADGHHRIAAASRVQAIMENRNSAHSGSEDYNFFLSVIFPDNQVKILDYNRVLYDLGGYSKEALLEAFGKVGTVTKLSVEQAEEAKPRERRQISFLLEEEWYSLTFNETLIPNDPVDSLDVALLQNLILKPIFGIEDPRTSKNIDFIGGIRGLTELEKRCRTDAKIAFALFPTGIDQLLEVADSGKVMPPKSTWFEPKLRSGLLIKEL